MYNTKHLAVRHNKELQLCHHSTHFHRHEFVFRLTKTKKPQLRRRFSSCKLDKTRREIRATQNTVAEHSGVRQCAIRVA